MTRHVFLLLALLAALPAAAQPGPPRCPPSTRRGAPPSSIR